MAQFSPGFFTDVLDQATTTLGSAFGNWFGNEQEQFQQPSADQQAFSWYQPRINAPNPFLAAFGQEETDPFSSWMGQQTASPAAGLGALYGARPGSAPTPLGTMLMGRNKTFADMRGSGFGAPGDPEIEGWIRSEAQRLGIDPEMAIRVAKTEGGTDRGSINRQNKDGAPAFGPFQLFIGGGLGDEAIAAGIDPRNPAHWRAAVTFALTKAKEQGWTPFQGAAGAGIGQWDGIYGAAGGGTQGAYPQQPTPEVPVGTSNGTPRNLSGITPAQYGQGLPKNVADAICGPVAATAFARAAGRNPSVVEAMNIARDAGLWDVGTGMHGAQSTVQLLGRMGIQAYAAGINKNQIIAELRAGRPVMFDTNAGSRGHYFVIEGYDPKTGRFDLGESARALKASGGRTWFTLEEVAALGFGTPQTAIYMRV